MSKYGTAPAAERTINGRTFASKAEMNRYCLLLALQKAGRIADLELQPEFMLIPGFKHPEHGTFRALRYRGDFRYREVASGAVVVEDVKGYATDAYRIKKTILLWRYPDLIFREIRA